MFVELMPLLAGRTVLITVAREDDKTVRVCVIPKKAKDDENPALSTPLSYAGTPEELDVELGKHLAGYVDCHTRLGSTLAQAKAEMEAAAKAAHEEAHTKAAERNKKGAEKPATNIEAAPAAAAAATMPLFRGSQTIAASADATNTTIGNGDGGGGGCRLPE